MRKLYTQQPAPILINSINRCYWIVGGVLYGLFSVTNIANAHFMAMHFVSFCSFLLYGIVMYKSSLQSASFFKKRNLGLIVFSVSILEVLLFHLLSFYIDGDTFVFSKADAKLYYAESIRMAHMPLEDGVHHILDVLGFGIDDLGAFLWISTMFRIIPSQQFLSFSYSMIGVASAIMLFDIGRNLMPRKYAFIAALSFSSASFVVIHYSQCLKETIMLCLIIAAFDSFFTFIRKENKLYLWLAIMCSILLFLFRTPTALLLLLSLGLTWVLLYLKGKMAMALSIALVLLMCSTPLFSYTYDRYLNSGDTDAIIKRKNELAGGGGVINQLADPVAALTGPFPSVRIDVVKPTPLYASGLLYRFLLSAFFFMGVFLVVKLRYIKMYPFILFFVVNAVGVAITVKGLEARLSVPHLAMMYIVAFWFLAKHDYRQIKWEISPKLLYCYFIGIFSLCLLWNFR